MVSIFILFIKLNFYNCQKAVVVAATPGQAINCVLVNAPILLSETLELDMKYGKQKAEVNLLNVFVIVFELPWLGSGDYF